MRHNAKKKLLNKNCDLIFANKVSNKFNPFGNDFNEITMITKETKESWKKMNKKDVAEKIIKKAFMYLD